MSALRIRVAQIIDLGPTVAIIGRDLVSGIQVTLHVDYRPIQAIQQAWKVAGLSELVTFGAHGLVLRLALDDVDDPDGEFAEALAPQNTTARCA